MSALSLVERGSYSLEIPRRLTCGELKLATKERALPFVDQVKTD